MLTSLLLVGNILLPATAAQPATPPPSCPPSGMSREDLRKLKEAKFEIASADERNALAMRLLGCLDDPDPLIRDGVVFEALSTWLRAKALSPAALLALDESLRKTLGGARDAQGFRLPFAALALSEVARTDRVEPWYSDAARASGRC